MAEQWDVARIRSESGEQLKIGSIVIRCHEFDKMLAFWQEALHYVTTEPAKGGWVILRDPQGRALYTNDQEGEVERLVKIGATRYPWRYRPDDDFVVLEDPDGNLFCVVRVPTDS